MLVALMSLFVALSGVTYAATALEKNSVKSKHIKDGQVKSNDVADGGVATVDLADGSVSTAKIAGNAVGTGQLGENAVNSAKIADNAVGTAEVAQDSLAAGDLANNSVTSAEIATGAVESVEIATSAVGSSEVENFSLQAVDVGSDRGNSSLNFGNIGANTCQTINVDTTNDLSSGDNVVAVTPAAGFTSAVHTVSGEIQDADTIGIRVCNISAGAADPDGTGTVYNWVMFEA